MRILSTRATNIRVNRAFARVEAVIVLRLETRTGAVQDHRVTVSASITTASGVPLRDRLVASAKLILSMSTAPQPVDEAELTRTAA